MSIRNTKADRITQEDLYRVFIIENKTLQETSEFFAVPVGTLRKRIKAFGIKKDQKCAVINSQKTSNKKYGKNYSTEAFARLSPESKRKAVINAGITRKKNRLKELNEKGLTKEKLFKDYILDNKSLRDLTIEYGIAKGTLRKILDTYKITKPENLKKEAKVKGTKRLLNDPERLNAHISKTQSTIRERYGNNWYRKTISREEKEILDFVTEKFPFLDVISGDYSVIKNPTNNAAMQLDIYIPEIKLAIEYNGEYWHDRKKYEKDKQYGDIIHP
jgi:hypothetical protein